jgi:hypothetical protein
VTSVRDFEFYENDLIIATHGRGIWVIDDISPLRQLTPAVVASDAYLFKPSDSCICRRAATTARRCRRTSRRRPIRATAPRSTTI